ncbi:hypothetical protein KY290_010682 [Solanum tuberosum]|uniref:Integrase core domain containing protein n=1 Tax=Solanum tuberosum TaxID=4113 RepID=A0ABQ7VYI3_SOLTU|nr:hypothetical protein KY290_010682 [Solanum tuberosum]
MLHGPEYSAPASIGWFEGKHHEVTSDITMEDQNSRERALDCKANCQRWGECILGTVVVVPHIPIDIPHADRCPKQGESSQPSTEAPPPPASASEAPDQRQTRTLVDQIVIWMPHLIEKKMLAVKNEIKDEMQKELAVLKDRMDGLEKLVQDRCQTAGSVETEEFKSQLAEMRTQVAKLVEKPVQVPTLIMLDSLMQMLNQAPSTQSIDDLWGELPMSKSSKSKHRTG